MDGEIYGGKEAPLIRFLMREIAKTGKYFGLFYLQLKKIVYICKVKLWPYKP